MNELLVNLTINSLLDNSLKYFYEMNNLNKELKRDERIINHCIKLRDKYFSNTSIDILATKINNNHIKDDYFLFGRDKIYCDILENVDKSSIICGIAYTFHAPEVKIREDKIEDILYIDSWQKSFLKACRDKLHELFIEKITNSNPNISISKSIEPGLYGIDPYYTKSFFKVCDGKKLNIKITRSDTLNPINSVIALNLILKKDYPIDYINSNWQYI